MTRTHSGLNIVARAVTMATMPAGLARAIAATAADALPEAICRRGVGREVGSGGVCDRGGNAGVSRKQGQLAWSGMAMPGDLRLQEQRERQMP